MSSLVSSTASTSISSRLITRSIGKKILMAITGFVSLGYIAGHMAGNLQVFLGQDQLNSYAEMLHSLGAGLWIIRIVLIIFFVIHIWLAIQLKAENLASRPVSYQSNATVQATIGSRSMIYSGTLILTFLIYHILHFTARTTDPRYIDLLDTQGRFDAYSMVVLGFQNPVLSVLYIISVALVALHISHGFSSMFQSMGWNSPNLQSRFELLGRGISILIFLGFSAVPIAVLAGWIMLPGGGN